uniref:Ig-like domain-containing protein n=1 Tax=Anabas testudineus TaxID=64144 RepID=A0AAQ6IGS3_ANATE
VRKIQSMLFICIILIILQSIPALKSTVQFTELIIVSLLPHSNSWPIMVFQLVISLLYADLKKKPRISINPAGEVSWGQDISITCSVSDELLGGTFILKKTSGSVRETQASSTNSATFNIHKVNFDDEGSYQCQYEKYILVERLHSAWSDSIRLSVTVSLPKPSISMNPAGDVNLGQDVDITCSISIQLLGGTFSLQQIPGSVRENQTSSTNSATFRIHKVGLDKEGLYQCQYHIRISGRDFHSSLSNSVKLSITGKKNYIFQGVVQNYHSSHTVTIEPQNTLVVLEKNCLKTVFCLVIAQKNNAEPLGIDILHCLCRQKKKKKRKSWI